MRNKILFVLLFALYMSCLQSQETFTSGNFSYYRDMNSRGISPDSFGDGQFFIPNQPGENVSPTIFFHQDLFLGLDTTKGLIEYGVSTAHSSQYDSVHQMGPVVSDESLQRQYADKFHKLFSVERIELQKFFEDLQDGSINGEHPSIFFWPGSGNKHLEEKWNLPFPQFQMAPFFDANENGVYEPELGEYPSPDGNELDVIPSFINWSVYHSLKYHLEGRENIEMHKTHYAYACEQNDVVNNTLYIRQKWINRGNSTFYRFFPAGFLDPDLGCPEYNYMGVDTMTSTIFAYEEKETKGRFCEIPNQSISEDLKICTGFTVLDHKLKSAPMIPFVNEFPGPEPIPIARRVLNGFEGLKMRGGPIYYGEGTPLVDSGRTVKIPFTGRPSDSSSWSINLSDEGPADYRTYYNFEVQNFAPGDEFEANYSLTTIYDSSGSYDTYTIVDSLLSHAIPSIRNRYFDEFSNLNCDYPPPCISDCVWPGNATQDEICYLDDFIEIGWMVANANLETPMPKRLYSSSEWQNYPANNWGMERNSTDLKHYDANGDGILSEADINVAKQNFLKTKPGFTNISWREPQQSKIPFRVLGTHFEDYSETPPILKYLPLQFRIGSGENPVRDLHSICFKVEWDALLFELRREWLNVEFFQDREDYSILNVEDDHMLVAITHVEDTSYSGEFNTFQISLPLKMNLKAPDSSGRLSTELRIRHLRAFDIDGEEIPLDVQAEQIRIEGIDQVTSWNPTKTSLNDIILWPNPVADKLNVKIAKGIPESIQIFRINGQPLYRKPYSLPRMERSNLR